MTSPEAGTLQPGARLGRYQIIRRIALGGMAELYVARQVASDGVEKIVAIKRVLPHLAEDAAFVTMFLNEAKLAATLDHSNIAHVMDFGSLGGVHFMAMEYVHGRSAMNLLKESSRRDGLSTECALTIVRDVASALHYAHRRVGPDGRPLGLVHRDVSPSNVLVSFDGDVKLVDFGIAKATAHTRATRTGTIKGKLSYMAPEQIRGEQVDCRSDVFSLGVVAYELTTGQRCFYAGGEFALINRVAQGRFERPCAVDPDYPPQLEAIIVRALSVDPADRFESAQAMQLAIEDYANAAGVRLSKVVLADSMRELFGFEAYPTTVALPMPGDIAAPTELASPSRVRMPRRRALLWTGAAMAAGLGIGLGARELLAGDPGKPTEPPAQRTVAAPAPVPHPVSAPPTAVAPEPEEPPAATPPTPRQRRTPKRARKPKRRTDTKPERKREYLPPSRRKDG